MKDLKERIFQLAAAIGSLVLELPYNRVNKEYFSQLVRASSSVGANYRAARRAKSNADFLNKLKICEEEADEVIYFLDLLNVFNKEKTNHINNVKAEATEILKILVASINTTRKKISEQR